MTYNEYDAQVIIDFWKTRGLNAYAISAWLGNWYIESGFRSDNAENSYMNKFGITDEQYTKAVDNGTWKRPDTGKPFIADSIGYGLAQWTSSGRKAGLYDYIKNKGKSISNMQAQLEWAYIELTSSGFKKVYQVLIDADNVKEPTIAVMHDFEKPASKDNPTAQQTRVNCAQEFYNKYFGGNKMSNSTLVDYTLISPNKNSPRNHAIDTITIHCTACQVSVERLGQIFAPTSKNASSNYGIGLDGRVGMYVEEKDRSWCSSSPSNDNRAVTIEVASDNFAPYKVNDAAYKKLILLVADICKRNNIKQLLWKGDKSLIGQVDKQNMTVHRWFAAKACPGDYLYNLHSQIAHEVNQILNGEQPQPTPVTTIKHTVAKGENLTKIANRYDATVDAIVLTNKSKYPKITKNYIVVGWVLDIPVKANAMPTTYTVVAGDTLSKIAKKVGYGCTWQELAKINNIKAPYIIRKGQVLKLPELK